MIVLKTVIEGLGLGLLICLFCAFGIRKGAVGLAHLYSEEVQKRAAELGLTTQNEIRKRGKILKCVCAFTYIVYVLGCVYGINGTRSAVGCFWQMFAILEIANIIDRLVIDEYWVGHSKAWIIPGTEDLRPYITSNDKKKKWIAGTLGFAVIAAAVSLIIKLIAG